MSTATIIALFIFAVASLLGCASTSSGAGGNDGLAKAPSSAALIEVFEEGRSWIPQRSRIVFVASTTPSWEEIAQFLLPVAGTADVEAPGTSPVLAADLRDQYTQMLGFDPMAADTVVGGLGLQTNTMVFFGDFDVELGDEARQVGGHIFYETDGYFEADAGFGTMKIPLEITPIEDPMPGVVVHAPLSEPNLESFLRERRSPDSEVSLANREAAQSLEAFFKRAGSASSAIVFEPGPFVPRRWRPATPRQVMLSYGETLELVIHDEPGALEATEEIFQEILT